MNVSKGIKNTKNARTKLNYCLDIILLEKKFESIPTDYYKINKNTIQVASLVKIELKIPSI
jgi:hypothetical protein